jgi:hypothetical protein
MLRSYQYLLLLLLLGWFQLAFKILTAVIAVNELFDKMQQFIFQVSVLLVAANSSRCCSSNCNAGCGRLRIACRLIGLLLLLSCSSVALLALLLLLLLFWLLLLLLLFWLLLLLRLRRRLQNSCCCCPVQNRQLMHECAEVHCIEVWLVLLPQLLQLLHLLCLHQLLCQQPGFKPFPCCQLLAPFKPACCCHYCCTLLTARSSDVTAADMACSCDCADGMLLLKLVPQWMCCSCVSVLAVLWQGQEHACLLATADVAPC